MYREFQLYYNIDATIITLENLSIVPKFVIKVILLIKTRSGPNKFGLLGPLLYSVPELDFGGTRTRTKRFATLPITNENDNVLKCLQVLSNQSK